MQQSPASNENRWLVVRAWRDRRARWARRGLIALVIFAVFGDFIANDKPLYCKAYNAEGVALPRFPAFHAMFARMGLARWSAELERIDWHTQAYIFVVRAPVPYNARQSDLRNANFRGPFSPQDVPGWRFRHWLGTDHIGRDVLAGMIRGARIALFVGLFSVFIAALLGIPLGAIAGYFGDKAHKASVPDLVITAIGVLLGLFYLTLLIQTEGSTGRMALLFFAGVCITTIGLNALIKRLWPLVPRISIPVDSLAMRSVEILRSIPAFFLLFAVLGMLQSPQLIYIVALIGILRTPAIIRYVRAEALKLRNQPFVQSAVVLGLRPAQVVMRHIIPNAVAPALITMAFGVGTAVLIESGLSFLGIGIGPEVVSWGKMLHTARTNFSAWWMAALPGLGIFLTIAIFNRLGDVLSLHLTRGGR